MTTVDRDRTPAKRQQSRARAEAGCRLSLLRMLCAVTALRTALTQVVPQAGCASWWLAPLCLLPGLTLYYAGALLLKAADAADLPACAEKSLGQWGRRGVFLLAAILLLPESAAGASTLVRLFTEGIAGEGSRWSIALVAGAAALLCLSRDGLSRCASFLSRPILIMLLLVGLNAAEHADASRLFPLLGDGEPGLRRAFSAGFSMGWPYLLLLCAPPAHGGFRWREPLPPFCICCAACLAVTLFIPHAWLVTAASDAEALLVMKPWLHAPVRMLMYILLMLTLFLTTAGGVNVSAEYLFPKKPKTRRSLAGVATGAVFVLSLAGEEAWRTMNRCLSFLIYPVIAFLTLLLLGCVFSRRRGRDRA